MIDFFFGKPRTGKTYRAVKYFYDGYLRDIEKGIAPKYNNILTNIGGFNFELVNKSFLDNGSTCRAYKLVWIDFYSRLKNLYDMAKSEKSDLDLNRYADYHHVNDCIIIIDEASMYLKKYDDVLSWYFAYHGHFRVRIIIIAQSPKQIYAEYMEHTEIYYEAQPQSKQLSNSSLRYIHYSDIPFLKQNKFGSSSIKTDPKIYKLYTSGEIDKPKKIIYKYIAIAIGAIIAVYLLFHLLYHNMESRHPSSSTQNAVKTSTISQSKNLNQNDLNNTHDFSNSTFITFNCFGQVCSNSQFKNIPLPFLRYLITKNKSQDFSMITTINFSFTRYEFLVSNDSLDLLKRSFVSQSFITSNQSSNPNNSFAVSSPASSAPTTSNSINKVNP